MNRLRDFFAQQPEPEPQDDFYEVTYRYMSFAVSRQTASEIECQLDRRPPPRWLVFRDLAGARHRVLSELITCISESTAAQRAAGRAFDRARRLEEKADRRPWEDDD